MENHTLTVSEITSEIKGVLEDNFDDLYIEGEISNFKKHSSGHLYFSLKDSGAQISCTMWAFMTASLFFVPRDGMQVVAHGGIGVYQPRGTYQLSVKSLKPAGEGALAKAFEAMKARLAKEGLFDERHKKSIPEMPQRIGIVTSETGAVIRDLLTVINRRFPMTEVMLIPVKVQGAGAAEEISRAIYAFNFMDMFQRPDVLIVGRGGGSIEDLWAFNEEMVARAIFQSDIPIISAVGHETDITIADFVADARAATPSMAAEIATPDINELTQYLQSLRYTITQQFKQRIQKHREHIAAITQSYTFHRPKIQLQEATERLKQAKTSLERAMQWQLEKKKLQNENLQTQLRFLNPDLPLQRGYVQVRKQGILVESVGELKPDENIVLQFQDGEINAKVIDLG